MPLPYIHEQKQMNSFSILSILFKDNFKSSSKWDPARGVKNDKSDKDKLIYHLHVELQCTYGLMGDMITACPSFQNWPVSTLGATLICKMAHSWQQSPFTGTQPYPGKQWPTYVCSQCFKTTAALTEQIVMEVITAEADRSVPERLSYFPLMATKYNRQTFITCRNTKSRTGPLWRQAYLEILPSGMTRLVMNFSLPYIF